MTKVRFPVSTNSMESIPLRRLIPGDAINEYELQRLLEAAPTYSLRVQNRLPPLSAARDLMSDLPPTSSLRGKVVLGFNKASNLIGCADLVRGYPSARVAYLGLLLLLNPTRDKTWDLSPCHRSKALQNLGIALLFALRSSLPMVKPLPTGIAMASWNYLESK